MENDFDEYSVSTESLSSDYDIPEIVKRDLPKEEVKVKRDSINSIYINIIRIL